MRTNDDRSSKTIVSSRNTKYANSEPKKSVKWVLENLKKTPKQKQDEQYKVLNKQHIRNMLNMIPIMSSKSD